MMPDANTIWTITFTVAIFIVGGLAWWSHYHRETYHLPALGIGCAGTLFLNYQLTVNQTLLDTLKLALPLAKSMSQSQVNAIIDKLGWPYIYSVVTLFVTASALLLRYVPSKKWQD